MDKLISEYRERGFCMLKSFLSDEDLNIISRELNTIFSNLVAQKSDLVFWRTTTDGSLVPDRLDPVLNHSEMISELVLSSKLCSFLEKILGGIPVVFKSKVIFKRPGTNGYGLHQDYSFWVSHHISPQKMITVWFVLDQANQQSGTMEVFPGYHHRIIPGTKDYPLDTDPALVDQESGVTVNLNRGDLLVFHPLLPHHSGPNYSDKERRALFVTYTTSEFRDRGEEYYQRMGKLRKYYDQKNAV
jgi:ectoine hydroxylase-related dioxygenase (phytanoyl-CoA dioxygenase family)